MRKLVLILLAFLAVVTFIRAFDNPGDLTVVDPPGISESINDLDSGS